MKRITILSVLLASSVTLTAQEEEMKTDAHVSNHRSWSIGLNVGPTASLGDQASYFFGDRGDNVPSGVGGFEIGVRGHITKFFSPSLGIVGTGGFHTLSGTAPGRYFEGNFIDGDLSLAMNLSNMFLKGSTVQRKNALLFHVGLGLSLYDAQGFDAVTNQQTVDLSGDGRSIQTTIPMKLHYKRYLNETWDLDIFYKHTILEDWADTWEEGATLDMVGYLGIGATYNFGEEGKKSIVYTSPLDEMFSDIQSMREDYDKLVGDDDNDGVANFYDKDNSTPEDVTVTGSGVALDSDGDGIPNYLDEDPFTMKGVKVDAQGRAIDSDMDGVPDDMDEEPNTPEGALVNRKGQEVKTGGGAIATASLPAVYFGFNSATVTAANHYRLAAIAQTMKRNSNVKVRLVGYADQRGPEQYNKKLAMRRAEEVAKQLTQVYGISADRIITESEGEADPLAQGRYDVNRRVDVFPEM